VRMTGIHEKEVAKLVSKINKFETSREELVKEKNETGKEVVGLKSEIREWILKFARSSLGLRIVVRFPSLHRASLLQVDKDRILVI